MEETKQGLGAEEAGYWNLLFISATICAYDSSPAHLCLRVEMHRGPCLSACTLGLPVTIIHFLFPVNRKHLSSS